MNPFKFIYKACRFIVVDTIDDFKFLFDAIAKGAKGERVLDPQKVELLRQSMFTFTKEDAKTMLLWGLVVLFAVCIGVLLSAKYYEMQCNNILIDNYDRWRAYEDMQQFKKGLNSTAPFILEQPSKPSYQ